MTVDKLDLNARQKRALELFGMSSAPLGGLSKPTPYEREHGHPVARRRPRKSGD